MLFSEQLLNIIKANDYAGNVEVKNKDENYLWTANGNTSQITDSSGNSVLSIGLFDENKVADDNERVRPSLENGKNVTFFGEDNTLTLAGDINQGAGHITFVTNSTVKGIKENTTWLGGGLIIADNKKVDWQVHNPEGDRLSELGKGTLHINGKGENLGSISVGEGTVILDQQAGEDGKKVAFSEVGIVSGRSTVVLGDSSQLNPNKIFFGHRGGS